MKERNASLYIPTNITGNTEVVEVQLVDRANVKGVKKKIYKKVTSIAVSIADAVSILRCQIKRKESRPHRAQEWEDFKKALLDKVNPFLLAFTLVMAITILALGISTTIMGQRVRDIERKYTEFISENLGKCDDETIQTALTNIDEIQNFM